MKDNDMIEEIIPKKYRCFTLVAYEESIHYNFHELLFVLKGFKYWAYIKHEPEEEEKQPHYHILIKLENATTIESISKKTGVPVHKIQYVRNIRAMARYMIHFDDDDKIQYDISQVKISKLWDRKFKKNFEDLKSEDEIIEDIYFFIDNMHYDSYYEKVRYLIQFVNFNCYDSVYKRYRYEFLDYLKSNL